MRKYLKIFSAFLLSAFLVFIFCTDKSPVTPENKIISVLKVVTDPEFIYSGIICEISIITVNHSRKVNHYCWYSEYGSLITNSSSVVYWKAPDNPGTYTLTCSINDGINFITEEVKIDVFPVPEYSISGLEKEIFEIGEDISINWNNIDSAEYYILEISNDEDFSDVDLKRKLYESEYKVLKNEISGGKKFLRIGTILNKGIFSGWSEVLNFKKMPYLIGEISVEYRVHQIHVKDNIAYFANGTEGLGAVDFSDPENPTYKLVYRNEHSWFYLRGFLTEDNYLYILDGSYSEEDHFFIIMDISNPENPFVTGECIIRELRGSGEVYISGNYAYIADRIGGFIVVDISDKSQPELVAQVEFYFADGIYVYGEHAFVTDQSNLTAVNIQNPSSPFIQYSYRTPGLAMDIAGTGGFLYIADYESGLTVFNIAGSLNNPSQSNFDTPGHALDVSLKEKHAFVAEGSYGLRIINIEGKTMLYEDGYYEDRGSFSWAVCAAGDYVFLGQDRKIKILRIK